MIERSVPTSFSYCLILVRFHERSFLSRCMSESARRRSASRLAEMLSLVICSPSNSVIRSLRLFWIESRSITSSS